MGCNFYWRSDSGSPVHVGKRVAGGLYCYTCHDHRSIEYGPSSKTARCIRCGATHTTAGIPASAALELGFRKKPLQFTKGVHPCSSFIFAQKPKEIIRQLKDGVSVIDECGREYTPDKFRQVLAGCVIKDHSSIGRIFA